MVVGSSIYALPAYLNRPPPPQVFKDGVSGGRRDGPSGTVYRDREIVGILLKDRTRRIPSYDKDRCHDVGSIRGTYSGPPVGGNVTTGGSNGRKAGDVNRDILLSICVRNTVSGGCDLFGSDRVDADQIECL